MTQVRRHEHLTAINAQRENEKILGFAHPGPLVGFDTYIAGGGLGFQISHDGTGLLILQENGSTISSKTGMVMSPQGVIISEDANITGLAITSNASNPNDRWDLLYGQHVHSTAIVGGTACFYAVKEGSGPTIPTVNNATNQFPIGVIKVPAGASTSAAATYQRIRLKGVGRQLPAYENLPNLFTALNQFGKTSDINLNGVPKFIPKEDGQLQYVIPDAEDDYLDGIKALNNGSMIWLASNQNLKMREANHPTNTIDSTAYAAGYRKFSWPDAQYLYGSGNNLELKLFANSPILLIFLNDLWYPILGMNYTVRLADKVQAISIGLGDSLNRIIDLEDWKAGPLQALLDDLEYNQNEYGNTTGTESEVINTSAMSNSFTGQIRLTRINRVNVMHLNINKAASVSSLKIATITNSQFIPSVRQNIQVPNSIGGTSFENFTLSILTNGDILLAGNGSSSNVDIDSTATYLTV